MNRLIVAVALGASVISAPVLAQPAGGGERGGWMQHDQTRAEAKERADRLFQMLDANHQGVVTRQQAQQLAQQLVAARGGDTEAGGGRIERMVAQMFGSAQTITLAQLEGQALARFDAMDLNHDGVVTAAERQQARELRHALGKAQQSPVQPPRQ